MRDRFKWAGASSYATMLESLCPDGSIGGSLTRQQQSLCIMSAIDDTWTPRILVPHSRHPHLGLALLFSNTPPSPHDKSGLASRSHLHGLRPDPLASNLCSTASAICTEAGETP